jgi:hypothetical protein
MLSPFPVALRRTGVRFFGHPFAPGTWGLRYLRSTGGQRLRGSGAVCEGGTGGWMVGWGDGAGYAAYLPSTSWQFGC